MKLQHLHREQRCRQRLLAEHPLLGKMDGETIRATIRARIVLRGDEPRRLGAARDECGRHARRRRNIREKFDFVAPRRFVCVFSGLFSGLRRAKQVLVRIWSKITLRVTITKCEEAQERQPSADRAINEGKRRLLYSSLWVVHIITPPATQRAAAR